MQNFNIDGISLFVDGSRGIESVIQITTSILLNYKNIITTLFILILNLYWSSWEGRRVCLFALNISLLQQKATRIGHNHCFHCSAQLYDHFIYEIVMFFQYMCVSFFSLQQIYLNPFPSFKIHVYVASATHNAILLIRFVMFSTKIFFIKKVG